MYAASHLAWENKRERRSGRCISGNVASYALIKLVIMNLLDPLCVSRLPSLLPLFRNEIGSVPFLNTVPFPAVFSELVPSTQCIPSTLPSNIPIPPGLDPNAQQLLGLVLYLTIRENKLVHQHGAHAYCDSTGLFGSPFTGR